MYKSSVVEASTRSELWSVVVTILTCYTWLVVSDLNSGERNNHNYTLYKSGVDLISNTKVLGC